MTTPNLLDLICRNEVIFNGTMSTAPISTRVIAYLGYEHLIGHLKCPATYAVNFLVLSKKHYKLTKRNPHFYRSLILRPPVGTHLSGFQRFFDLHSSTLLSLDLSFCHEHVSDSKLQQIADACPLLAQCVLWGCHQITDKGLQQLTICQYLSFLNFGACPKISDKSLERIGHELLYLDNLHMSGCIQISDVGIQSLIPSRVVLQLHPTDNPRIPPEHDLHHMKTQLRKFGCTQVTYRSMRNKRNELVLHFKSRPKAVNLWCELKPNKFMPKLTSSDNSYHYAGSYVCTSLKVLNVVGCSKVTEASTSMLKGHHIQMKILR